MKLHAALFLTAALTIPSLALAQVQSFSTSAGKVEITPVYHATVKITAGGDTIYIDPAKPAKVDGKADLIRRRDTYDDLIANDVF